jgi:pyruvate ferredoxin oxidoreductase gamma subunit
MRTNGYKLPYRDARGFCNVLVSALGGDGANMMAKLLFKIGVEKFGLDGGYDATYGSEKKGTPTDVSVRFCNEGTPIRECGPTTRPHILAIFHADLIATLELGKGLQPDATVIVNSTKSPQELRDELQLHSGEIVSVDATGIAVETGSRLNMPILAQLCAALDFPADVVVETVAKTWPKAKTENLKAFTSSVAQSNAHWFEDDGRFELRPYIIRRGQVGYLNMLNGGAIDALTHSTVGRDNRVAGRGRVPIFKPEECTHCGICMTVCSDPGGLLWRDGKLLGIDAAFCKGCMRCVEVCPISKKGKGLTRPDAKGKKVVPS